MKIHKKWFAVTSIFIITNLLSGCNREDTDIINIMDIKEIFSNISIGMTKDEVFEIITIEPGDSFNQNTEEFGYYKNSVEYIYYLDKITISDTDIDMTSQLFFEFEDDNTLICYGYHIGGTGDYDSQSYPYSETKLTGAYDVIYSNLCDWYGESISSSDFAEYGVIKENFWNRETDLLWFIVGTNLWADTEPARYEDGVNEIVLSCSASERVY